MASWSEIVFLAITRIRLVDKVSGEQNLTDFYVEGSEFW